MPQKNTSPTFVCGQEEGNQMCSDHFLLELVICVLVYVTLAYTQLFLYYLQLTY